MIYYFSDIDGDDSRTSVQAQNSATPWQTIAKLNSFFGSLLPGDSVAFKRGEIFYGEIIPNVNGITLTAYGVGAKPIISGFTSISSWTSLGGNQYSASIPAAQTTMNILTIDDIFQPIGRWPKLASTNSGYLTYQSHSAFTSITSDEIASALSYVDGEVVIRANHFNINRGTVTGQTSTTVTYSILTGGPVNPLLDNFGFFFQNHPNACTENGDWAYTSSTKTVTMYNDSGAPTGVKISTLNNNVTISGRSNITFDNISFQGSNQKAISLTNCTNIIFQNCDFSLCGTNGISTNNVTTSVTVTGSTFSEINNNGIDANNSSNWNINNNTFNNIYKYAGMGVTGDGQGQGMSYLGNNSMVEYNTLTNLGFNGIMFRGDGWTCQYNFIDGFCSVKDDAGGIYSYLTTGAATKLIKNNIVLNGIGAPDGTNGISGGGAIGIYFDGQSLNTSCIDNTVANCQQLGIVWNYPNNGTNSGNTSYNNGGAGQGGQMQINGSDLVRNFTNTNNIFVAKQSDQFCALFYSPVDFDVNQWFVSSNNNSYARPIAQTDVIFKREAAALHMTLPQWKTFIAPFEADSIGTPVAIVTTDDLRFEYNNTNAPLTVSLGADSYIDVTGIGHIGSVTLEPFTSIVLIRTDAVLPTTGMVTGFIVNFTPCFSDTVEEYEILYRAVGETDYISAGSFSTSPAVITGLLYPAGTTFDVVLRSQCGDVVHSPGSPGNCYTWQNQGSDNACIDYIDCNGDLHERAIIYLLNTFCAISIVNPRGATIINIGLCSDDPCPEETICDHFIQLELIPPDSLETTLFLQFNTIGETGTVDWGDGVIEAFTVSGSNNTFIHTYSVPGTYTQIFCFDHDYLTYVSNAFMGDPPDIVSFSKSSNINLEQLSLQGVLVIEDILVLNLSGGISYQVVGSPNSLQTSFDVSVILGILDILEITLFPLLTTITNAAATSGLHFNANFNLTNINAAGTIGPIPGFDIEDDGLPMNLGTLDLSICNNCVIRSDRDSSQVDAILIALDANGLLNGNCDVRADLFATPAPPGPSGATAASNLVSKGWTVLTD